MGDYLALADLNKALSPRTVKEIFDDNNDGVVSEDDVADVIARAEAQVNSYLPRGYESLTIPVPNGNASNLLRQAALLFAIPYAFMRHPEYVRTFGDDARGGRTSLKEAHSFMERLTTGRQYLNDVPNTTADQKKPSTVGGVVLNSGPRVIVDNDDGSSNTGDF